MGGRGANSGRYRWRGVWHTYGDEYHTVYQYRNIKFIKSNNGSATAPMETQTQGRIYVTVRKDNKIKSITYYRGEGSRRKQIDLDHMHNINGKNEKPHTHMGYVHDEHGSRAPNTKERRMIVRVQRLWYNFNTQ